MGLIVKRFYGENETVIEAFNWCNNSVVIALWENEHDFQTRNSVELDIESAKKFAKVINKLVKELEAIEDSINNLEDGR